MDPLTIGASVVTLLTPYVADAGKELVKAAGETGVEKTKELMHWLKAKFAGDPVATSDLSRFEKDPEGYAKPLRDTIDNKAKQDPAFSAEVSKRMTELGPVVKIVQDYQEAKNLRAIKGDVAAGNIDITQKGLKADDVVAIEGTVGR